jgi:hypothetical protein
VLLQFLHPILWWWLYPGPYVPAFELGHALAGLTLLFLWYRADKAALGLPPSAVQDGFVVMLGAVAIPVHLIKSRGWTRGLTYLSLSVAVVFGAFWAGETVAAWCFYSEGPA